MWRPCWTFSRSLPGTWLEVRTKSTQIRGLRARPALPNVVVAFSFTPETTSRRLEHRVPALDKRIAALAELAERGWRIGLRFDPVIYDPEYRTQYEGLFNRVSQAVDSASVHSVTLGAFRMPRDFHARIAGLYPEERLFAMPMTEHRGVLGYPPEIESEMLGFCRARLRDHVPEEKLFDHEVHGT